MSFAVSFCVMFFIIADRHFLEIWLIPSQPDQGSFVAVCCYYCQRSRELIPSSFWSGKWWGPAYRVIDTVRRWRWPHIDAISVCGLLAPSSGHYFGRWMPCPWCWATYSPFRAPGRYSQLLSARCSPLLAWFLPPFAKPSTPCHASRASSADTPQ